VRVLVVSAHPDDEILGVGGTIAAHVARGDWVKVAVLCEGVSMRYAAERHAEVQEQSRRAAAILGVADIVHCGLPDQRLDTLPLSDVVREVERLVEEFRPEIVYTHFGGDINRDHQVLAEAVLVAVRPYAAPSVREVLMFETSSSTEWGSAQISPVFQPNAFVDIGETLERKVEAFLCYSAEVRDYPHPRSGQALRDRAHYWGSIANRAAVEPFVVVRSFR
jgi:LmbE family N-acetylglucosaminyl deacetylase